MAFFTGYMGLVAGGPASIANEVSAGGYARLPVSFSSPGDGCLTVAASSSYIYGLATEDWGLITGIAIYSGTTPDESPVATWAVRPRSLSLGQTYTVPLAALSLLIEPRAFFDDGDVLGVTAGGADIIAGQPLMFTDGVLTPASDGSSSSGSLTLAQLSTLVSELMQSLPEDDPGDGTSLWVNSGLLAISRSS
ncbi:hypothetical protein [Acetobacter oeni]|uniref:Uncharacterized protein n=1 Tax=Acetobacter oeni TaxID=304077 RepID=A0A511XIT8_9PROT|nr:hypothetical protein [Acetobacter oeni]MBB3881958.1 hypothetical protein [Acetobacter oeni]NHO17722.1 hypothetical protein [Acetobacter oeni]GBR07749.1 hypothetical protein AA21952_2427 [Acetobacter oeni LMG 21952]GEN62854.1 hypothetical protein AOE01nite_10780 [Acetobacter oeni]